jgi:hypothetical protein
VAAVQDMSLCIHSPARKARSTCGWRASWALARVSLRWNLQALQAPDSQAPRLSLAVWPAQGLSGAGSAEEKRDGGEGGREAGHAVRSCFHLRTGLRIRMKARFPREDFQPR